MMRPCSDDTRSKISPKDFTKLAAVLSRIPLSLWNSSQKNALKLLFNLAEHAKKGIWSTVYTHMTSPTVHSFIR